MNWYTRKQSQSEADGKGLPSMLKKQRQKVEDYEVCPHCNQEIGEKSLYTPDFKTWTHRECGGKFNRN